MRPPVFSSPPQHRLSGIAYRLAGVALFGVMAAALKLASKEGVSAVELIFYRSLFALPVVIPVVLWSGGGAAIRTRKPSAHLLRGTMGLGAMLLTFQALIMLPLAEATTIGFAAPLFATLFSALILHERVGIHRWLAVAAGFAGVVVVMHPAGSAPSAGHLVALASALGVSLVTITIRQLGATESATATVFWFTLLCLLAGGLAMPFWATAHPPLAWLWLVLVGLSGGGAQFMMTQSLRLAPVSVIAPFDYTQILWATALGWAIWGDAFSHETLIGAALVIASGLYTVHRERKRHLAATAARATPPIG